MSAVAWAASAASDGRVVLLAGPGAAASARQHRSCWCGCGWAAHAGRRARRRRGQKVIKLVKSLASLFMEQGTARL